MLIFLIYAIILLSLIEIISKANLIFHKIISINVNCLIRFTEHFGLCNDKIT